MPRMRPVLLCAAVSISLHAAVLAYRVAPASQPSARSAAHGNDGGTTSRATQVRVIPKQLPMVPGSAEIVKEPPQEAAAAAAPSRSIAGATASEVPARSDTAPSASPQPGIEQATPGPMHEVRSQTVEAASPDQVNFDGSDYIPRSLLSVPPSALVPIVLAMPEGDFAAERYTGVLSLFIDEEGHVKHVAAEGVTLPPTFEQVARETFMAAPFLPGQLEGRAVKSRQRVEVVFDNRP